MMVGRLWRGGGQKFICSSTLRLGDSLKLMSGQASNDVGKQQANKQCPLNSNSFTNIKRNPNTNSNTNIKSNTNTNTNTNLILIPILIQVLVLILIVSPGRLSLGGSL